ncbi:lectin-like domain-containing protein, partial [Gemelliphila palaticanis]
MNKIKKDRYSIRKFKIGVGSVFLGSLILGLPFIYDGNFASANELSTGVVESSYGESVGIDNIVVSSDKLVENKVDKASLNYLLQDADILVNSDEFNSLSDTIKSTFLTALEKARQVNKEYDVTQEEVNKAVQALEQAKEIVLNSKSTRVTAITYYVEFIDANGVVVNKIPYTHEISTTESVASATITVSSKDLPHGYSLSSEEQSSITKEIVEKQKNVFTFFVVKDKELKREAEFTGFRNGTGYTLGNAEFNPKAKLIVTPDNQDNFFRPTTNAHKDGNIVTLTDAAKSQVGAYTLFNKISMAEDFVLTGKINIGDAYEGFDNNGHTGGDGVAFVFTTAQPGVTGLSGASIGLGGINNSFGFKLDTFHNTTRPRTDVKSDADPKFSGYKKGAFGAFYRTDRTGVAKYDIRDAAKLNVQPTDNSFQDITVSYNGKNKTMTVNYAGQTFTKDLTSWLAEARKTTGHAAGQEEMAFALFASTGGAYNLQQFDLKRFEYTAGGSSVIVKYVDANTGREIKDPSTHYSDGRTASVNLEDSKNIPGYVIVGNNVSTARGYQSGDTINYVVGAQTVTYSYKVDKRELESLLNESANIESSAKYYNETTPGEKTEYTNAISSGRTVFGTESATVESVREVVERIKAAKQALDGQETNKSQLESSVNEQSNVQNTAPYYNGSSDKQNAYNDAISKGRDTLNKANVTQAEVNAAKEKIERAKEALNGVDTNKEELRAKVEEAPTVQQSPKYYNATPDKKSAYDDAVREGQEVLDKANATQEEVNAAKEKIERAKEALDGVDT